MIFDGSVVELQLADKSDNLETAFRVPITEVGDVNFPKLQMSGGCSLHVNGEKYRLSFLRPQNTRIPIGGAIGGVASISGGRKAGKAWKEVLGA